ncbi:MAG: RDD family protein [Caulobacterales bacterium]|nr:RDD family protein [Caulobacterales bacterium]MCA0373723.1 RDD family protein [Pseudomonadota bacterium]
MFCQICGNEIDEASNKCFNCEPVVKINEAQFVISNDDEISPIDNQTIEILASGKIKLIPNQHTWKRFAARTIDHSLFIWVTEMSLAYASDDFANLILGFANKGASFTETSIILLLLLLNVIVEPIFLTLFGTTIGKSIFGLRVYTNKGEKLSYGLALKRSFLVWLKGEALCLPIISLFAMKNAQLKVQETGTSDWDFQCDTMVFKKVK